MKLHSYSIMPLDIDHLDEICLDIERQVKERISSMPLFEMTLVPVGTPPRKEAEYLCEKYDLFRERLESRGVKTGVLVQASIGHGWHLPDPSPFRKYVNLSDGKEPEVCCPADPAFRAHFHDVFKTIASHRPSFIMLDDDFRLMARPGKGCACAWHVAEFNRRAGTDWTREELWRHISETGPHDPLSKIYIDTQLEALIGCAREMRAGIDEIDPLLPGAFCACGNSCEAAADVAKIMAGRGNPVIVRLNNANYTAAGARNLSKSFFRAASQREVLGDRVDVLLAETDTCPQLRYSTAATMVHAHFSGSILEGARGAKHWITDLENADLSDGEAYRRKLAKYAGFYETLADLAAQMTPLGCRIPLSSVPTYSYTKSELIAASNRAIWIPAFARCVLERMGLPMYFSSRPGGVVFLDGDCSDRFSEQEREDLFRGTLVLDSAAALSLIDAGYGDRIGISVEEWTGDQPGGDWLKTEKQICRRQINVRKLIPQSERVTVDSVLYKGLERGTRLELGPGVTRFQREGGETVVFAGTPDTAFDLTQAFSFLSAPRKKQLIRILRPTGCLPVYYPGDAEVYLRAGRMPDGALFCGVFNLGFDVLDEIPLTVETIPTSVSRLTPEGKWEDVPFKVENDTLTLPVSAGVLSPEIFLFR